LSDSGEVCIVLIADIWSALINVALILLALVLIVLVLIQRGRGGGLIGALGGSGGSSPFGSRAGDTFTRITLVVAGLWILTNMVMIWVIQPGPKPKEEPAISAPEEPAPPSPP
jgi:preprotein translocase subunit SecG